MRSSYLHACGPTLMSAFVNKEKRGQQKEGLKKEEGKMMKEESKMMKEEVKGLKKEEDKMKKKEDKMKKEEDKMKELVKEIEEKRILLIEKVVRWSQGLSPLKDVHVKIKGRYYPLIGKETGKLYIIDKVEGKKISFNTLEDQKMKYVIISVLAERKEEIEKEVEEEQKKYLQKKLEEVNKLLNKF